MVSNGLAHNSPDRHVKVIAKIHTLEYLDLSGNKITDVSVPELAKLKNLTALYLTNTQLSSDGIEQLKRLLPNTEIHF
jgi:Leucine-rich repeat (LRR) protein